MPPAKKAFWVSQVFIVNTRIPRQCGDIPDENSVSLRENTKQMPHFSRLRVINKLEEAKQDTGRSQQSWNVFIVRWQSYHGLYHIA